MSRVSILVTSIGGVLYFCHANSTAENLKGDLMAHGCGMRKRKLFTAGSDYSVWYIEISPRHRASVPVFLDL